jgi:hypothetical protein
VEAFANLPQLSPTLQGVASRKGENSEGKLGFFVDESDTGKPKVETLPHRRNFRNGDIVSVGNFKFGWSPPKPTFDDAHIRCRHFPLPPSQTV